MNEPVVVLVNARTGTASRRAASFPLCTQNSSAALLSQSAARLHMKKKKKGTSTRVNVWQRTQAHKCWYSYSSTTPYKHFRADRVGWSRSRNDASTADIAS